MKKIMLFAGLLILMLAIYVAGHMAVYFALVKFFAPVAPIAKKILAGGLVFLAVSFFVSTWLSHISDNFFTRGLYFLSGSWLGLALNLLLFFILAWLSIFVLSFFHI